MVSPIKIVSRVVDQGEQIHNTDTQHSRIMGGVRTYQHKQMHVTARQYIYLCTETEKQRILYTMYYS